METRVKNEMNAKMETRVKNEMNARRHRVRGTTEQERQGCDDAFGSSRPTSLSKVAKPLPFAKFSSQSASAPSKEDLPLSWSIRAHCVRVRVRNNAPKTCTMLKVWVKSSSRTRDSSRHAQRASDWREEDELNYLHTNELSHICWTLALKDLGRLHEFNLVAHRVTQRLVIAAHQGNCIPTRCITKRQH
jgi:hypothetical protein